MLKCYNTDYTVKLDMRSESLEMLRISEGCRGQSPGTGICLEVSRAQGNGETDLWKVGFCLVVITVLAE